MNNKKEYIRIRIVFGLFELLPDINCTKLSKLRFNVGKTFQTFHLQCRENDKKVDYICLI
jgi:hypothetical protein